MPTHPYPKVAQFRDPAALEQRLAELGLELPVESSILTADEASPLAAPLNVAGHSLGNRWCIHPMEGWDAHRDGTPSELTLRRWQNFGRSGAKLIWGGEAAAVQPDGRANPRQTLAVRQNRGGLERLLHTLRSAHQQAFGTLDGLLVGLQLTHSGRFSRPTNDRLQPRIAYHHPLLDQKFGIAPDDPEPVWQDTDLELLIDQYELAAGVAREVGFQFVDIKACHGYLLHEFLSAHARPGPFGGDYDGRTRLLRTIIQRVRKAFPDLLIGVRLSVYDSPPFERRTDGGHPMAFSDLLPYRYAFGVDADHPLQSDLTEPIRLLRQLQELGVAMVNISCGSPYYNPHLQRPAFYPPSDGYPPPEDPLMGVVRQVEAVRQCKLAVPELTLVGSGYSYLQDYLPHVAQGVVRSGWVDVVGLGRMVLSYPELPADVLSQGSLQRKRICRTFSDCTTAPRNGIVSGCFPLDPFYKQLTSASDLQQIKQQQRREKS